jgi:hypothetical protein
MHRKFVEVELSANMALNSHASDEATILSDSRRRCGTYWGRQTASAQSLPTAQQTADGRRRLLFIGRQDVWNTWGKSVSWQRPSLCEEIIVQPLEIRGGS